MWFEGWYDGSINGDVHSNSLLPRVVTEAEVCRRRIARDLSQNNDVRAKGPATDLPFTTPTAAATAAATAEPVQADAVAATDTAEPVQTDAAAAEHAQAEADSATAPTPAEPAAAPPSASAARGSRPRRRGVPRFFVAARGDLPGIYRNR